MPQTRQQPPSADPESSIAIRTLALGFGHGHSIESHDHTWPQLVFATAGVLTVHTATTSWIVPSARALWMPAQTEHGLRATGAVRLRTIYLRPDIADGLPAECAVVEVCPFLRELILHVVGLGMLDESIPSQRHLTRVLVHQLSETVPIPLALRLPSDRRALRVAKRVLNSPSDKATLDGLAHRSGASRRTLERLFRAETGMTFGRWRQQVRLFHALELLALGRAVTEVAMDAGYDSTSAFIAMFQRTLGTTPGRYVSRRRG
jgi:AraC-like DNA-binding protein